MKQKIFGALLACVLSIATLNSFVKQNTEDISLNQVGATLIITGTSETGGSLAASMGGSAIMKGVGAYFGWWGAGALLTPAGWIIAGAVLVT